jgi:hypothetical protein
MQRLSALGRTREASRFDERRTVHRRRTIPSDSHCGLRNGLIVAKDFEREVANAFGRERCARGVSGRLALDD